MKKANNWFFFADEDLKTAEAILKEKIYNQVCFHSQQGVEKTLKGFSRSHNKSVPRTHSLVELIEFCAQIEPDFTDLRNFADRLEDYHYYVSTRYPDVLEAAPSSPMPNKQDAKEALEALRRIMDFVDKKLKEG